MRRGGLLRLYLMLSHTFPLIAPRLLNRRLARGKEHPDRWSEKCGRNLAMRPEGRLVWLNAVGLGEVLSLRGLINAMTKIDAGLSFLVTSTTRASADVFARHLPPRTLHQFLPIDAPSYRRRFLEHFRPDLCIWAEQDLWPGMVSDLAKRSIPQVMVAARMADASRRSHMRVASLYRDLYGAMSLITAQDQDTASNLAALGAQDVQVTGSLKPSAPPLGCDPEALAAVRTAIGDRKVWAVAPSHPEDEEVALNAHDVLRESAPDGLLIIAPRYPDRAAEIAAETVPSPKRRSLNAFPSDTDPVWICDTFGELGLIYRLCDAVLIGGTFSAIEGHSPWEAAALNTAVLHGPRYGNFKDDYKALKDAGGAIEVSSADELLAAIRSPGLDQTAENAKTCVAAATARTDALAGQLLSLINGR